ncbi:MAG: response regulator [Thiobacillaceae bacterium]
MQPVSPEQGQSILLIGEEKELTEDVSGMLALGLYKVAVAYGVDETLRQIKANAPNILVFASPSIVDAERVYLEILRKVAEFQATPHYTIITCKGTEVETAYDLCRRNVFDDYVVVRPLYDRYRLAIAVQQAIRVHLGMEQLAAVSNSIGTTGLKLEEFSGAMEQQLAQAQRLNATVQADAGRAQDRIVGRLADIGTKFYQSAGAQFAPEQVEAARRKFQDVARTAIQPELANAFGNTAAAIGKWTTSFEKDLAKGQSAMQAVVDQAAQLRAPVIVIDDDPVYCDVVAAMLEDAGFRAQGVGSIAEALRAFSKERYCCALVDFELPDGVGVELIARLWSMDAHKTLPVVLMTGHSERRVVEGALAAGIRHFIVKPAQRETIIEKLHDALAA